MGTESETLDARGGNSVANRAFFPRGDSNPILEEPPAYYRTSSATARGKQDQQGQTKLALQSLWVDLRRPLAGSPVEVVFGVNGLYQTIRQKDVVFWGVPEPVRPIEIQTGLGGHMGFHGKGLGRPMARGPSLFWDGELLLGTISGRTTP
jgi:hypothetical protein